jgi:bla regulator protein BlaR1
LVCAGMAIGQTAVAPTAASAPVVAGVAVAVTATAPAKAYAFDVISIRQNISGQQMGMGMPQFGPTADGYRMINMSMGMVIMTAYVPQTAGSAFYSEAQVKGAPDWFDRERYDIEARISDEDRADWQKPEMQKVMLQAMLQAMLAERCKLVVHREVKEVAVNSLVVAKGGPKFKETDPTVEHPGGMKLPWGGVLVPTQTKDGMSMSMYGTSMASLASLLSTMGGGMGGGGRTIVDNTGLKGRYDVVFKFQGGGGGEMQNQTAGAASDPGGGVYSMLGDLGLKLESNKAPVETLVIDHMERPSEN